MAQAPRVRVVASQSVTNGDGREYEKPFLVRAIWNDGQFTYIDAAELRALYEKKDGSPSLVNFQVQGSTYVIPKLLDSGYLALGKQHFPFSQQGR